MQFFINTVIIYYIWSFSLHHDISPWVALKGQIKVIWCSSIGLYIIFSVLLDSGAVRSRGLLFSFLAWSLFGMTLITFQKIWLNRSKGNFSKLKRSNLALFEFWRPFAPRLFSNFIYFGIELPRTGTNEL